MLRLFGGIDDAEEEVDDVSGYAGRAPTALIRLSNEEGILDLAKGETCMLGDGDGILLGYVVKSMYGISLGSGGIGSTPAGAWRVAGSIG